MNTTQKNILVGMLALSLTVLNGTPVYAAKKDKAAAQDSEKKQNKKDKKKEGPKGVAARVTGVISKMDIANNGKTVKVYAITVEDDGGTDGIKGKTIPLYGGPANTLNNLLGKNAVVGGVLINKNAQLCVINIAALPGSPSKAPTAPTVEKEPSKKDAKKKDADKN